MPQYLKECRFYFSKKIMGQFRKQGLGLEWAKRYPNVFDEDDVRLLRDQHRRAHFFEWLGAILIYESTSFRSLVAKYGCLNHPHKLKIMPRVCSPELLEFLTPDLSGCPDLLCYREDSRGCFFCEVKGPGDQIRDNQHRTFKKLYKITGMPVRILHFESVD